MKCKCKCDNSCETIKVTSIVLDKGAKVTLNTEALELSNLECFRLLVCKVLPKDATTEPVYICPANGTSLPLFSISGNYVRVDELRCRCVYPIVYGTDPKHYSLKVRVPVSGFEVV